MFHPVNHPLERGWVGRIDDDRVVQLAAQTLQSLFTGGGSAREHAVYPLAEVRLLAPVLHPPAVRVFDEQESFAFANPAAIIGPFDEFEQHTGLRWSPLELRPRLAAVIGAGGRIGGFTNLAEWRAPDLAPPKDRDFALGLGPAVATPDEMTATPEVVVRVLDDEALRGRFGKFDWSAARDLAADGTSLKPGDILAGPPAGILTGIEPATAVDIDVQGVGTLRQYVGTQDVV
jgi:hypothetical protein